MQLCAGMVGEAVVLWCRDTDRLGIVATRINLDLL